MLIFLIMSILCYFLQSDHVIGESTCIETTYGCCPDQSTAADGPEFLGCPSSDPIPDGACILSEFGCCEDGVTSAEGPFSQGCPPAPSCKVRKVIYTRYL